MMNSVKYQARKQHKYTYILIQYHIHKKKEEIF